ncbi:hypothetical protein T02_8134 [Trichinella nativa]|uniref:Uncharacterized protein n=1 Tax=Trichinella nativa TaxID=6335 RepID=A0A0V1L4W7_9BILA|nr:hypothetical protein T02_8134 [Trichinella nativa]
MVDFQVQELLYLPFPTASPPMDKVHQSAPGSSNTNERTDLVTRPRADWSLADQAIPSREQNSSTILPNSAWQRGMFGSMMIPHRQSTAFPAIFATSHETKPSQDVPVSSVLTDGRPTSFDIAISGATETRLSCRLAPACRRSPCQVATTVLDQSGNELASVPAVHLACRLQSLADAQSHTVPCEVRQASRLTAQGLY